MEGEDISCGPEELPGGDEEPVTFANFTALRSAAAPAGLTSGRSEKAVTVNPACARPAAWHF